MVLQLFLYPEQFAALHYDLLIIMYQNKIAQCTNMQISFGSPWRLVQAGGKYYTSWFKKMLKKASLLTGKTECLVISNKEGPPSYKLTIRTKVIKQVNDFNCLGSWITSDGRCDKDIKRRIGKVKDVFMKENEENPDQHKNQYQSKDKNCKMLHHSNPYIWHLMLDSRLF